MRGRKTTIMRANPNWSKHGQLSLWPEPQAELVSYDRKGSGPVDGSRTSSSTVEMLRNTSAAIRGASTPQTSYAYTISESLTVGSHAESHEQYYNVIGYLNKGTRVILCNARLQWIIQFRRSAKSNPRQHWQGRYHYRNREQLIIHCQKLAPDMSDNSRRELDQLGDWAM